MLLFQGLHGRHFKQQLTLPHLRSFNMADQALATLNAKIDKAEARRDKLEALEAAGVAVNQERLAGVQNELSALQVRLNNLMQNRGENLASRSPPPASSLVAPCMPANPRLLHVPRPIHHHG
jgi:ribosomal protein L12E/L44/L45/RPP1/RPP2